MGNNNQQNWLQKFAREHPFQLGALAVSSSVFLCSCIGFFREYLLLKRFGINVATFAEVNDFLVAGLKDPTVLAVFPVMGIAIIYLSFKGHIFIRGRPIGVMVLVVCLLYPFGVALAYIPFYEVRKETDEIVEGKNPVTLHLRDKTTIGSESEPLTIISTTEKYIFLYQYKSKQPLVTPTASVSYIKYLLEYPDS
ncbi:hypothetical protein [Spartinivicinus ruber]|uniref:hypothetical protein n=1 Tax=Spartinivicinus ruber TaxID=2683272 RepID=UPI0013D3F6B9|nr:hypothetical protein [Spartinivicinus ruber]